MRAKYEDFEDLHNAVTRGEESRTRIKIWVDGDSVNAWEWDGESQGRLLARMGRSEDALTEVLHMLQYDAEHV